MRNHIYLLASMIKPGYWDDLTIEERAAVTEYLEDMYTGPADGEMDIEWQTECRGYYRHLEVVETIKNENQERVDAYLNSLESDMAAWLELKPACYLVQNVASILGAD